VPEDRHLRPLRRRFIEARGALVLAAFDLNHRLLHRFADRPARWDLARLPWASGVEDAHLAIRAEIERYLVEHRVPDVAEMVGLTPGTPAARAAAPVDRGAWRTLVVVANGRRVDGIADHFPVTMGAFAGSPRMSTIGFSVLTAGGHIAEHADPNHGSLRYQLPLVVPGGSGDCRIRIAGEDVALQEGRSVVFDVGAFHEVWNDTDADRVLLLAETSMPLRWPLGPVNRSVQWLQRYHPSHHALATRVRALAAA
jgi:hypothetical protein